MSIKSESQAIVIAEVVRLTAVGLADEDGGVPVDRLALRHPANINKAIDHLEEAAVLAVDRSPGGHRQSVKLDLSDGWVAVPLVDCRYLDDVGVSVTALRSLWSAAGCTFAFSGATVSPLSVWTADVWATTSSAADLAGGSERTTRRHLTDLADAGLVEKWDDGLGGSWWRVRWHPWACEIAQPLDARMATDRIAKTPHEVAAEFNESKTRAKPRAKPRAKTRGSGRLLIKDQKLNLKTPHKPPISDVDDLFAALLGGGWPSSWTDQDRQRIELAWEQATSAGWTPVTAAQALGRISDSVGHPAGLLVWRLTRLLSQPNPAEPPRPKVLDPDASMAAAEKLAVFAETASGVELTPDTSSRRPVEKWLASAREQLVNS